jgi:hypothetical protein
VREQIQLQVHRTWRIEQTYGTLMLHRRLARDYETRPESAESMIYWSMTDNMTRRLTGTATTFWRESARASPVA